MTPGEKQLSDEQSRSVASLIREELARRRISRQRLADQAKISISTLEKALSGRRPFTLATTIRLEEALGVPLRKANAPLVAPVSLFGIAPTELGNQLTYADRKGFRLAIIAGENEFAKNVVQIKNLASKTAHDVPIGDLVASVQTTLRN